jgi:hypothetical protein
MHHAPVAGRRTAGRRAKEHPDGPVRIVGGDGKQAKEIPLKGIYFEMPLPGSLFEGNLKAITVNWIDFYRG